MILNKKLENYWLILLSLPSWECGLKFQGLRCLCSPDSVTPFVGVWIEIGQPQLQIHFHSSLPSWECGLKYNSNKQRDRRSEVTPFVGVWIEICEPSHACELNLVTPFVGVWIEIPFIY